MATNLTGELVLRKIFDDTSGRIKVDADVTASSPGALNIAIDDVDDSIKIGNGSGVYGTITNVGAQNGLDVNLIPQGGVTGTVTSVASSASNVNLLASNIVRKGATITNDSTAILYLKLGTTASTTSYTIQIASQGYYELPFNYRGNIDGIWASANGYARITELT